MNVPPRVVLVGPPGAGKSTIGRRLARELGVALYDTDAAIEQQTGRSIREIFASDGEAVFRRIEERVVRRAVRNHPGVVSLGGGAVLSEKTRQLLRGRTVVYLEIGLAEGLRRTGATESRPLLAGADPTTTYRDLLRRRRPLYREVASVRVRTDGRSPGRVVRAILTKLSYEPKPSPAPHHRSRRRTNNPSPRPTTGCDPTHSSPAKGNRPDNTDPRTNNTSENPRPSTAGRHSPPANTEPHRRRPRRRRPRQPNQSSPQETSAANPDPTGKPPPGEGRSRRSRTRRGKHTQPPGKPQQTREPPRTPDRPQSESERRS